MAVLAPDTLVDGRYRIVRRLGAGGMAEVYCAQDTELGRQVALKLLYSRFAQDPGFVERFRREASAAAGLQHPNVVQVYDRGEWDGTYYIAMEFLPGRSLKQVVREHGPLDPALAADLTIQILQALGFAHRRGIVHRDIKPHNVIVDEEGRAKVTDFGIARAGASDMTETGSIMGTAQYLSPEQAQGHPVDARTDLYSTGVVLYELLTGTVPFDADSPVTIALKQVTEAPVPAAQRNPAVPPELDAIVRRALAKDPAARFQTAEEFVAALRGGPVRTVTTAVVEEPLPEDPEERAWGRIAAIALAVLALAAILIGAFLLLRADTRPVPNVVGKSAGTATQILQSQGFEVNVVPIQSDTVPEDRVAGQRPEPGSDAEEGSEVTITVSSGPGEASIPLVQGLSVDQATAALREAGFRSDQRREFSDAVRRGRVIETTPPEGSSVQRGSTVTLVVSRGPQRTAVPGVVGLAQADAEAALEEAGFAVGVSEREDAEAEPGVVLEQSPAEGAQARLGARVDIVVATAPPAVEVPQVEQVPEDEAVATLEAAGFTVTVEEATVETLDQDGVVQSQDPPAGSERAEGTTVTIVVGRFAPPELDPDPTPTPTPAPTETPVP